MFERVFIVALTGPTLALLRSQAVGLPTFSRFLTEGAWGELEGPLQPVVPASVGSLLTGKNPGKTGLFDFFQLRAGGYERIPYSRDLLGQEACYERVSQCGRRVGVLGMFLTFPLPRVDGFVVSDDEGIGESYATPPEVQARLEALGYGPHFGASYAPGRELAFFDRAMEVLAERRRALRSLFGGGGWSLGMLGIEVLGELLHAFWRHYDRRHPRYEPLPPLWEGVDPLRDALRQVDELLAEVIELTGPRGLVMVAGPYGHRSEHSRVHFNALLEREGYLRYRRSAGTLGKRLLARLGMTPRRVEGLVHRLNLYRSFHYTVARGKRSALKDALFLSYRDVDWERTKAVASGYHGQVYLNVRGHRPAGVIAPEAYGTERARLQDLLAGLRDPRSGEPMVERVFRREELYAGGAITHAPDLVIHLREGYSGDSGISGDGKLMTASALGHSSDHWNRSLFLALGEGVRRGKVHAALEDIAPTALHALEIEVPDDYDGKVLPIFRDDFPTASR